MPANFRAASRRPPAVAGRHAYRRVLPIGSAARGDDGPDGTVVERVVPVQGSVDGGMGGRPR